MTPNEWARRRELGGLVPAGASRTHDFDERVPEDRV